MAASIMQASDDELISRLRNADSSALETLYDRYAGYVYAVALRILSDAQDAEEVTQDVFWQLWKSSIRYDPSRGRFSTWLFTITRSRSLDRLRARRRAPTSLALATPLEQVSLRSEDDGPDGTDRRSRVSAALESLPEAQRRALWLCFFMGLTHREAAETLGEPLGTVKSRIRTGMETLKLALRGEGSAT